MSTDERVIREAEDELRAVVATYKAAPKEARRIRDEGIRRVATKGLRQIDIIRISGYSRETVRQALKPEARERIKQAAEARKAEQ